MPIYSCEKCRKEFTHKGMYTRHLERKYSCIEKNDDHKYGMYYHTPNPVSFCANKWHSEFPISSSRYDSSPGINEKSNSLKMVLENKNKQKVEQSLPSSYSKPAQYANTIADFLPQVDDVTNTIKCKYCQKKLKNRKTLNKHYQTCKFIPLMKCDMIETKLSKKNNNILQSSESKNIHNIQNIQNNTINNTSNTQNIIYVDNRNIDNKNAINAFGKEQLDFISKDLLKNLMSRPEAGIIKLIEHVHFNKEQPENQNIQYINRKEPYVEVFNGEKWEKQDKRTAIQNMITTKKDIMDDYFDEQVEKNLLSTFIKTSYETFSKMLDDYIRTSLNNYDESIKNRIICKCRRLYKELFKQAELIMINNHNHKLALKSAELLTKEIKAGIEENTDDFIPEDEDN